LFIFQYCIQNLRHRLRSYAWSVRSLDGVTSKMIIVRDPGLLSIDRNTGHKSDFLAPRKPTQKEFPWAWLKTSYVIVGDVMSYKKPFYKPSGPTIDLELVVYKKQGILEYVRYKSSQDCEIVTTVQ
jgi:hypothetical protein